jgi:glucose/arabinose dehydrogenase
MKLSRSTATVVATLVLSFQLAAPGLASAQAPAAPPSDYKLEPAFTKIQVHRPVAIVIPPDGSNRLFLVQQRGKILILPKDESTSEAKVFLDFTDRKMEAPKGDFEMGLLGLAFHPKFAENRKFYVYYTGSDMMRSIISELHVSKDDPSKADLSTERVLLEQPQPFWNHNCGNLLFGPDGYLYIPFGDGGKRDDATRGAQNMFMLLGKVLRIDVDHKQGSRQYGIPEDNPFVKVEGARPEIWALGLRNPWGIHFDQDGNFWLADVGQDIWEEVNLIEKGGNYGWSFREGARPFPLRTDPPPADAKFIDPIFEYAHSEGISITGGFVYRGEKLPKLKGAYLCGDWGLGGMWALWLDKGTKKLAKSEKIFQAPIDPKDPKARASIKPTGICEDASKEVLVLDWNGAIYRMATK